MSRCCLNCPLTCSFKARIEMIGKSGSTEAMAWRTWATDTLAPGLVTMIMSLRKCELGLISAAPAFGGKSRCASGRKNNGAIGLRRFCGK